MYVVIFKERIYPGTNYVDESSWSLHKCCPLKTVHKESIKPNIQK